MKVWLFLLNCIISASEILCPSKNEITSYRRLMEKLITKVSQNPRYYSSDPCEPTMIGFRCRPGSGSSNYRYCETLLYRFQNYHGDLRAYTFAPQSSNNYHGQKCVLKSVIYKPDEDKRGRIKRVKNECYKWTIDNEGYKGYIDAQWSSWSDFTPCSVTCGNGSSFKRRTCKSKSGEIIENEFCGEEDQDQVEIGCELSKCDGLQSTEEKVVTPETIKLAGTTTAPPLPTKQVVLIKTAKMIPISIDECFTFNGQRDPDGRLIESEKDCILGAISNIRMNGLDDDQLDLIISSFANRLLQLGAEFESLAETSSDRK